MKKEDQNTVSDLFLLPIQEKYLFLSPLHGISAIINASAAKQVKSTLTSGETHCAPDPNLTCLINAVSSKTTTPRYETGELNPSFLGIVPTRSCNGACRYCGFGASSATSKSINLHLIQVAIEWFGNAIKERGRQVLEVHLFGGEPFVAQDAVVFTVHETRAKAAKLGLRPYLEVSTNGVMSESLALWTGQYFDAVVLSLDGTVEAHDYHRPLKDGSGSFSKAYATARILSRSNASLCIRCCISNRNIADISMIARQLGEEFNPDSINFETVVAGSESHSFGIRPPDPFEFAAGYIQANRLTEKLGIESVYSAIHTNGPRNTVCPVGRDTVILLPDGRISSCYLPEEYCQSKGQPCMIGSATGNSIRIDTDKVERLRNLIHSKTRCERCFCRWTCCGGCHVDVTPPGCSPDYDDYCLQTRVITAHRLLEDLDAYDSAGKFLKDRVSQERLARNQSDRIENWSAP